MNKPQWSTPIRQAHLVELWLKFNNQCLHGHNFCNDASHYAYTSIKSVVVGKAYQLPCFDRQGNRLLDASGNQYTLELWKPIKSYYQETVILRKYDFMESEAIRQWKIEDRIARSEAYKLESRALHGLGEVGKPIRGQFNNIARDIYHQQSPLYRLEAIGFNPLTLKPFAKIKIAGSYMSLYVELGNSLHSLSKNKKRKAMRYGKPLPLLTQNRIDTLISLAYRDYRK